MGATDGYGYESERPVHQVTLSSFLICKYEVTQELWQSVMGSNPSTFIGEKLPVNNVSWNECQEFIKKLNTLTGRSYRLPTEAEWEYAARGGAKSTEAVNTKGYQFAGGYQSTHSMIDYCWYKDNSAGTTHAVGLKNPNELGLYDMSGNVSEYCKDNHTWTYPNTPQINPLVEDGSNLFIYRGGSYNRPLWQIRIASRYGAQKNERDEENGLRLALDATGAGPSSRRKFALSYSSQGANIVEELSGIRFVRDGSQDRYAWTNAENNTATYISLGEAFDIKNVKYISRFNVQLAEAEGEELYKALEQETAYGKSDVDAVMKALESNPNVDYSSSSEEESVVVKVAGDSLYTVYIVNPSEQPFGDSPQSSVVQSYRHTTRATPFYESTGRNGKIAVFNYFTGLSSYDGQNKIIEGLMSMFNQHDYGVEYYPYELFTQENLLKVIDNSAHYKAIIVMSHGTYNDYDSHSYIAVSDEYTRKTPDSWNPFDAPDSPHITDKHKPWLMRIWSGTRYNAMLPTYTLTDNVSSNCILYIGACEALKGGGVLKTKTVVGWKTVNTFSQAHATILFSRMLNYGKSLKEALKSLIIPYSEGELLTVISEDKRLVGGESTKPIYEDNLVRIEMDQSTWPYYRRQPFYRCWHYAIQGKVTYLTTDHTPLKYFYLKFVPLVAGDKEYRVKVKVNKDGTFSKMYELSNFMDGAYHVVFGKTKDFERNQLPSDKPYSLIYSDKFKENSADDVSQADGNLICIVDDAGNETYKLSMTKGSKKSLQIFEYEENSYSISLDREGVVSTQLNGMQIDINAIQEGATRLVVHQQDKERTSVIEIVIEDIDPAKEINVQGIQFVRIKGGSFEFEGEEYVVKDFYISKTEISQKQWKAISEDMPGQYFPENDENPVGNVSRINAMKFISTLSEKSNYNFRLPLAAELYYVASEGKGESYFKALTDEDWNRLAWTKENSQEEFHPVATKQANSFGLYDLLGNVEEHVLDNALYYKKDRRFLEWFEGNGCYTFGSSYFGSGNIPALWGSFQLESDYANLGLRVVISDEKMGNFLIDQNSQPLEVVVGGLPSTLYVKEGSGRYYVSSEHNGYTFIDLQADRDIHCWATKDAEVNHQYTFSVLDLYYNISQKVVVKTVPNSYNAMFDDPRNPLSYVSEYNLSSEAGIFAKSHVPLKLGSNPSHASGVFTWWEGEENIPDEWTFINLDWLIAPMGVMGSDNVEKAYINFNQKVAEEIEDLGALTDVFSEGDGENVYALRFKKTADRYRGLRKVAYRYQLVMPSGYASLALGVLVTTRYLGDESDVKIEDIANSSFWDYKQGDVQRFIPNVFMIDFNGSFNYRTKIAYWGRAYTTPFGTPCLGIDFKLGEMSSGIMIGGNNKLPIRLVRSDWKDRLEEALLR